MKSLIRKIANLKKIKELRNTLNIRPIGIDISNISKPSSVSDAFFWRTDKTFETIFRYTDIINLLSEEKNNSVDFIFFSNVGKIIKKLSIKNIDHSNELKINKDFFSGLQDFGTFNIFHNFNEKENFKNIISNRCYLGYSIKRNLYSFVHGNSFAKYRSKNENLEISNIVNKSFFKTQKYIIQNNFNNFDRVELLFANPVNKRISFKIFNKNYNLNPNSSIIIETEDAKTIEIVSNCYFLRPIVFGYKNEYLDVHHA